MFTMLYKRIAAKLRAHKNCARYKYFYDLHNIDIIESRTPEIFNVSGEAMSLFFLRDRYFAHAPYGGYSKYILWDRYNYGLKTHFYTHDLMLHPIGSPTRRYGYLFESQAIVPNDYLMFKNNWGLHRDFDVVFTHSDILLDTLPNARFAPPSMLWYGSPLGGGEIDNSRYTKKTKNISIVSSSKTECSLHELRLKLARHFKTRPFVDTFGTFDGGKHVKISETLDDYRYSIVCENCISPYYFTEKIMNCFASMTVPVYIGATKISEYFNKAGIIQVAEHDINNIEEILRQCSEEDYLDRVTAIIDNFNRVFTFQCAEDYIYKTYFNHIS